MGIFLGFWIPPSPGFFGGVVGRTCWPGIFYRGLAPRNEKGYIDSYEFLVGGVRFLWIFGEWSGVHPVSMDILNSTIQWSKPHAGWRYRKGGVIHLPNLKDIFTMPNFQWVSTGCPIIQPTSIVMVHGNWMDFDCSSPPQLQLRCFTESFSITRHLVLPFDWFTHV